MSLSNQLFQDLLFLVLVWQLIHGLTSWEIIIHLSHKPKRKRKPSAPASSKRKPFPGLIKKPPCQICEQERHQPKEVPEPPPLMVAQRGRPAEVDTSRQFCPTKQCGYYGWLGRGNIVANGHPSGGVWRQFRCKGCGCWFLETHGTVFFGRRQAAPILLLVLAALVEGMGIRAAGRVFGLDPNTVQRWLGAAAEQLSAFAAHFLVELKPEQVQLDELYAPLAQVLETETNVEGFNCGSSWVWTAMDPVSKLLMVMIVGDRSLAVAQAVVHQVKQRLGMRIR